ncbi:MAG: hypothetical protein L0Y38_11030 [Methylococcaceae bacterium]|nr:hypothetical protein [Methylococcaceae bacterium]
MGIKRIPVLSLYLILISPGVSPALEVDINGTPLRPAIEGNPCIDITGEYGNFKIVPSEVGMIPQICFDNIGQNHLEIHHVTFESTRPPSVVDRKGSVTNDVVITFSHEFPPGPNGVVTARAHLYGFFSTSSGVKTPVGDTISLKGYFSQDGNYDLIADPFAHTVDEAIESGVFQFGAKKKYLVSGRRLLRGELRFSFTRAGDKLTLPLATGVKVDLGSQFEDRLDALEAEQIDSRGGEPIETPEGGKPAAE